MKIEFWLLGKTAFKYLDEGIKDYTKRLERLTHFEIVTFPEIKSKQTDILINKEAEQVLDKIKEGDWLILLDERGKTFDSIQFSKELEKYQLGTQKKIIFLVGGAYGFSEAVYHRANALISLSPMTFSHQLIRVLFLEQLYRAFTIIKGLPYHHE